MKEMGWEFIINLLVVFTLLGVLTINLLVIFPLLGVLSVLFFFLYEVGYNL